MALVEFEEIEPGIGVLTLNDPSNLNAMGEDMAREFKSLIGKLDSQSLRAVILTGAGRAFSAGGNLDMLEKKTLQSGEQNRQIMLNFYASFLSILELNIPLIAAVNGHAIGAGLCVACACDIRIASEGAKLGMTFTRLGLHPGMGGTYWIPRFIGIAAASEFMLTGKVVEAQEAKELGLVSRVVPAGESLNEAMKVAREISENGPEAIRQTLASLRAGFPGLNAALEREALCQSVNYASREFKEGVRAAIEKRKPNFRLT